MSACYVILAHVTWALAREWALFIRAAKTVTGTLTREWALARDTTVIDNRHLAFGAISDESSLTSVAYSLCTTILMSYYISGILKCSILHLHLNLSIAVSYNLSPR